MSVQVTTQNDTRDFILGLAALSKDQETIIQDAGRSAVLSFGTVMAKISASQKWTPLTSLTAVDGSAVPQGIYVGPDIAAADLVAGDVVDVPILVGNAVVDENQVVLENSLTLDDVFVSSDATNVYFEVTVRDLLAMRSIFVESSVDITEQQS